LKPAERAYVDNYVTTVERDAARANERVSLALYRPIPSDIIEQSRGMLDRPLVRAAITERINEIAAANELTVQRVVKELMAIGFSSLGDYRTLHPISGEEMWSLDHCTPEQLAAVQSVEIIKDGDGLQATGKSRVKIKLHDKLVALKMLGEYMGLLTGDNPFYRAEMARPATVTLPADATADDAASLYGDMINR
jgi:hypothetical protein